MQEEIENLLKAGIITPSSSPYASPIHIIPKAGPKKFRMLGDYRALNNITQPDRNPLPYRNDIVDKLNGCNYFSKIDCLKGYHQIPMAEEDAHKTAIITPAGLYEYKTMPFGMRNCGNTFQKFIDTVTRGLNCFAYVDDVLIASATLDEHEQHLRALFDRFKMYGIVVNQEKCVFAAPELTFLGHLVSNKGIKPLPEKVKSIKKISVPKSLKEFRRFLGMVNYYRRFIPHCSSILRPLNDLLSPQKNRRRSIKWTLETEQAFTNIKNQLSEATMLAYPVPNAETAIFVDASELGCGAALQQKIENNWQTLAFFSYNFSRAQSCYAAFDRELLAAYLAVRHFRYFVEARKFSLYTDHLPLCHALHCRSRHSSPRQLRHLEFIAQFTSDIRHIKGKDNAVADFLSRITASVFDDATRVDLLEIALAQQTDKTISAKQIGINSSTLEFVRKPLPEHGISILGDMSKGRFRPFIPPAFRKTIFDSIHSLSHPGIQCSTDLISDRYHWPSLKADVKRWCQTCVPFQQLKVQRHIVSPLTPVATSSHRFENIHVDLVGPLCYSQDHCYLLTIIDRTTR